MAVRIVQLRFWALMTLGVAGLFHSSVMAQQGCIATPIVKTFESCNGPPGTPNRKCTYWSVLDRYDITCTPPQSMTPPAPPLSSPPPRVVKTAEEIESEQHVKFCKEFPAEIDLAVQRCQNQALGYQSYFIAIQCPKGGGTWRLKFSVTKAVTVDVSKNVSAADCRAEAEANLKYYQDSCKLSGNEYLHILRQQCSDVP